MESVRSKSDRSIRLGSLAPEPSSSGWCIYIYFFWRCRTIRRRLLALRWENNALITHFHRFSPKNCVANIFENQNLWIMLLFHLLDHLMIFYALRKENNTWRIRMQRGAFYYVIQWYKRVWVFEDCVAKSATHHSPNTTQYRYMCFSAAIHSFCNDNVFTAFSIPANSFLCLIPFYLLLFVPIFSSKFFCILRFLSYHSAFPFRFLFFCFLSGLFSFSAFHHFLTFCCFFFVFDLIFFLFYFVFFS